MLDVRMTTASMRRQRRLRTWYVVAAVVGIAMGVLARNLPVELAVVLPPGTAAPECPTTGILDCLVTDVAVVIGGTIKLALMALAMSVIVGLAGAAALTAAAVRLARRWRTTDGPGGGGEKADWVAASYLSFGSALLVSGGWLPVQFILFLLL